MAEIQKYFIFLLSIVIFLQFQFTEARPIKFANKKEMEKKKNGDSLKLHQTSFSGDLSDASTDDFRPTSPGYSPGVGHPKAVSTTSQSDHIHHTIVGKEEESSTDDFRPTEPGYSPGVGHPMEVSEKDDHRPTQPGHSPGAGHPKEVKVSTDGFRPTGPGYSPGVGHRKEVVIGATDDYRPTQPGHSPGVGHKNL
ncbi:precursor of CEP9 [Euphorbia lathyris]|uniref:precursor of CEP9 n=1 Tax=Euphorbia lathyris TaxID=212925 RepID=UPI0033141063